MGYPTTVQAIERKKARQAQWYVNFPNAIAQALNFEKGETVEWEIESTKVLILKRVKEPKRSRAKQK
jgi:antitoxin component of MazEF toxin-antitoxin module